MQVNISCGEKEIAQHQVKMPALCDSVFTYRVLSLLTVSPENQTYREYFFRSFIAVFSRFLFVLLTL